MGQTARLAFDQEVLTPVHTILNFGEDKTKPSEACRFPFCSNCRHFVCMYVKEWRETSATHSPLLQPARNPQRLHAVPIHCLVRLGSGENQGSTH